MTIHHQNLKLLIDECRGKNDVDSQISLLCTINETLPRSKQLKLPSLITDDYVFRALEIIEARL